MTADTGAADPGRPLIELRDSGLLWLINRTVFHPRGYALALITSGGQAAGWDLVGDGSEPWRFADDGHERELFERAEATLKAAGACRG